MPALGGHKVERRDDVHLEREHGCEAARVGRGRLRARWPARVLLRTRWRGAEGVDEIGGKRDNGRKGVDVIVEDRLVLAKRCRNPDKRGVDMYLYQRNGTHEAVAGFCRAKERK